MLCLFRQSILQEMRDIMKVELSLQKQSIVQH